MKTYKKPEIEVVNINIENSLLAGSLGVDTGIETSTQYTKGNEFWDDEEDEF